MTNSIKAWFLAARPKTLTGAAVPVAIALSAAFHDAPVGLHETSAFDGCLHIVPAALCLLFALFMQVDANFVNDYFDFKSGVDREDRLGPERACAQGWITPQAMRRAIVLTTLLSLAIGLPLIYWGGWTMMLIAVACVAGCFLYTTFLSGRALGDLLVLLYFGIVPICATYYLQLFCVTPRIVVLSVACGLVVDTLMVVNNYRDRDTDHLHGKRTLVILIGESASETLYLMLGAVATVAVIYATQAKGFPTLVLLFYLTIHTVNWNRMCKLKKGRELNNILGRTSLAIMLFGIATCFSLLFQL